MGKGKRIGLFLAALAYSAVVAYGFYWIGYRAARDNAGDAGQILAQTFYAEIAEIQGNTLTVEGLQVNDINFRDRFIASVGEETKVTWRYEEIPLDALQVGDTVSITFSGAMLDSYPAQLVDVQWIQLLEDELE